MFLSKSDLFPWIQLYMYILLMTTRGSIIHAPWRKREMGKNKLKGVSVKG